MEWPKELLKIFEDPLFANIHPDVPKMNADDRLKEGFKEICDWYEEHQKLPSKKASMKEHRLAIRLETICNTDWKREALRPLDKYNLLDMES